MTPDQIELQRLCCARIVENHERGRRMANADTLSRARAFLAAHPPLNRPLGTGEPLDPRLTNLDMLP